MPELPEVETVVRTLAPRLVGRRIHAVILKTRKAWAASAAKLRGRRIQRVERYGKYILLHLDRGVGAIHLGMTGKLMAGAAPGAYTRAVLVLDQGRVVFDDVRQFGSVRWLKRPPDGLGPDALSILPDEFVTRMAQRRGRIKALLLNQAFVRGIGNIYADESLFRARIHPLAPANRLSKDRALRLHRCIVEVLSEAVASGGSSISDYVDADGRPGWFQFQHRVYQRTGEPCVACGAKIRRILVAQRSTHYCPRCQRQ
ncbi:MAG: bifunctional DNA-formamidopyrimidine glycosylase/DNA-(apurinic or apyrimidinic site) lyase [Bryobacteraceae bacterium]|nr:bifunctional DNA-formamidopyrimidine glycosylase/DNA-(apurinic or apyrimidinic site) lyase [Bryobacteraceae bacterium]